MTFSVTYYPVYNASSHKVSYETHTIPVKCGWCGKDVHAKIVSLMQVSLKSTSVVYCPCGELTLVTKDNATFKVLEQHPISRGFISKKNWPKGIAKLYDEASICFSNGAYTACAMMCRKTLMGIACNHGELDGLSFAAYVTIITDKILVMPKAKATVDKIRDIGNEANHDIDFIDHARAEKSMQILTYIANAIYDMPLP